MRAFKRLRIGSRRTPRALAWPLRRYRRDRSSFTSNSADLSPAHGICHAPDFGCLVHRTRPLQPTTNSYLERLQHANCSHSPGVRHNGRSRPTRVSPIIETAVADLSTKLDARNDR